MSLIALQQGSVRQAMCSMRSLHGCGITRHAMHSRAYPCGLVHMCSFNKTEQDFSTKDEWDDYLESVEDISKCTSSELAKACFHANRPCAQLSSALGLSHFLLNHKRVTAVVNGQCCVQSTT